MKKKLIALGFMLVSVVFFNVDSSAQIKNLFKKSSTEKSNQKEEEKASAPTQNQTPTPTQNVQETPAIKPHLTPNTKTVRINNYTVGKSFSDGLVYIQNSDNNKHGFLDVSGNLKIGYEWDINFIGDPRFNSGYCVVHKKGPKGKVWYIIDREGKETAMPSTYYYISDFCEGRAIALNSVNGKTSVIYIDHTGKTIFPALTRTPQFAPVDPDAPRPYKEGLAAFFDAKEKKWGFHDNKGVLVIPAIYQDVEDFSEGMAAVQVSTTDGTRGKWGYIDATGKVVIEPKFSTRPSYFSEGTAVVVKQNNKYCAIDKKGEVISPEYTKLAPFYKGYAFANPVNSSSAVILLDKEFKQIKTIPNFNFSSRKGYVAVTFFDDLASVGSNGIPEEVRGRIIDPQGNTIITQEGTNASIGNFFNGRAYCYARINGTYYTGFINEKGEYVFIFDKEEF